MKTKPIIISAMLLAMLCVLAPEQASAQRPRPHTYRHTKPYIIKGKSHRGKHKTEQRSQGNKKQSQCVTWKFRPAVYTRDTVAVMRTYHLKKSETRFIANLNSTAINHANQAFQFISLSYDPLTFSQNIWYNTILPILGVESSDICVEINNIYIYMADNCLCFDIVAPKDTLPQIIGMKLKNIQGIYDLIGVLQENGLSAKIKVNDYDPITSTPSELFALIHSNADMTLVYRQIDSTNSVSLEDARKTLLAPHTKPFSILALKMVYGEEWRDAYKRLDALFSNPVARHYCP